MIYKTGDIVNILDTSSHRIFRDGIILEANINTCRIFMLDCNDIVVLPLEKIKRKRNE